MGLVVFAHKHEPPCGQKTKNKGEINVKKIISIALALLMVAVMLPVMAMAADSVAKIGDTEYPTLKEAFDAVKDGETIVLLKDCSGDGIVVQSGKNFTVDFNNCTYNIDGTTVGSPNTETNGFQLLKDSIITFKNGKLTSNKAKILIQNYCNLTLENMVLDGLNLIRNDPSYTLSNNNGSLTVKGNSKIIAAEGQCAFDVYYWPNNGYTGGIKVTFDESFTGEVVGTIEYGTDGTPGSADWADKAVLTIKGNGTFTGNFRTYNLTTDAAKANITINGGTFTDKESGAEKYLAPNKMLDASGNVVNKPIIIYTPTVDTPKANDQKNPGTGANDFVGVAAAMAVVSLLGAAAVIRKK